MILLQISQIKSVLYSKPSHLRIKSVESLCPGEPFIACPLIHLCATCPSLLSVPWLPGRAVFLFLKLNHKPQWCHLCALALEVASAWNATLLGLHTTDSCSPRTAPGALCPPHLNQLPTPCLFFLVPTSPLHYILICFWSISFHENRWCKRGTMPVRIHPTV